LCHADIAHAGLNSVDDLARHAALSKRTIANSLGAEVPMPAHPVAWNSLQSSDKGSVPTIGQHSDAIRKEFAL